MYDYLFKIDSALHGLIYQATNDRINVYEYVTPRFVNFALFQLQSLLEANPDQGLVERTFQQAVESTLTNIQWMDNNYEEIANWLQNQRL